MNNSEEQDLMRPVLEFTATTTDAYVIIEIYNDDLTYDKTFIMSGLPSNTKEYTQKDGKVVTFTVPEYANRF